MTDGKKKEMESIKFETSLNRVRATHTQNGKIGHVGNILETTFCKIYSIYHNAWLTEITKTSFQSLTKRILIRYEERLLFFVCINKNKENVFCFNSIEWLIDLKASKGCYWVTKYQMPLQMNEWFVRLNSWNVKCLMLTTLNDSNCHICGAVYPVHESSKRRIDKYQEYGVLTVR